MMSKLQTKSCGMDLVPTHALKEFPHVFSPMLTKIVNLPLSTETFDDSWKVATFCPLIKNFNGPTINQSYRAVSNLSFFILTNREMCSVPIHSSLW